MFKRLLLIAAVSALLIPYAVADEGMWLFNTFPAAQVKAKYGFEPTQAWLDHVRLSSVRFNNGGSGSFVSPDGLAFTNHHVAQTCLAQLGTAQHDYMKTGFYAKTRSEEAKCPDLELNVLEGIEDVTAKVQAAGTPQMSVAEKGQAERAEMSKLENDCNKSTGLRCDIVTLYSGGIYNLYKYKKYTDVRLVFAPEFEAAFFGGDPDNFEYPRYDLDVAFFRVYENNQPVRLKNWFKWSTAGVKDGELIFVSGNPGSTDRLATMAQLQFMRATEYPFIMKTLTMWNDVLKAYSAKSAENARQAQEDVFGLENSIKAYKGEYTGLTNQSLMDEKARDEQKLKDFVASNPKLKAETGDPWAAIAKATDVNREIFTPYVFLERRFGFRGTLNNYARILVRAADERKKPNAERLREYRESALPSLEQTLLSTAPVYKGLDTAWFEASLADVAQKMPDDPAIKKVLNGRPADEVAREAIANTKLDDLAVRKELWANPAAVEASTDPLIVIMRTIDPEARSVRKRFDDEVDSVNRNEGAKIARARFDQGGTSVYPDATFTLRLSYGKVAGYTEGNDGPTPPGTKLPYFTTIGGAFEHATAHGSKPPYQLPESWMKAKSKLKLDTPLNVIETADIIGGNSGSPVVNTAGEVVGIIFDGNIYSNAWNFMYEDKFGRSLHVDGRGITEALKTIYGAEGLVAELTGAKAATTTRSGLDGVLDLMDVTSENFDTAQADFAWDQYTKVVDEHDIQKGSIYFHHGGKQMRMAADVREHNGQADKRYILYAAESVKVYQPSIDQVTNYKVGKNKNEVETFLVIGFGGNGRDLLKSFDVKYAGTEKLGGIETAKLELRPKSAEVRNNFNRIVLWIDTARGVSIQQQFFSPSGDYRLAKYSNIKMNEHLPETTFRLKTTASTKFVTP